MLQDDIIYVLVLLVCVGFGHYYRQIRDVGARQWAATGFGLLACLIVTGKELVHPIICTLVSGIIITKVHWKYVQLLPTFRHPITQFLILLIFFKHPKISPSPQLNVKTFFSNNFVYSILCSIVFYFCKCIYYNAKCF